MDPLSVLNKKWKKKSNLSWILADCLLSAHLPPFQHLLIYDWETFVSWEADSIPPALDFIAYFIPPSSKVDTLLMQPQLVTPRSVPGNAFTTKSSFDENTKSQKRSREQLAANSIL